MESKLLIKSMLPIPSMTLNKEFSETPLSVNLPKTLMLVLDPTSVDGALCPKNVSAELLWDLLNNVLILMSSMLTKDGILKMLNQLMPKSMKLNILGSPLTT